MLLFKYPFDTMYFGTTDPLRVFLDSRDVYSLTFVRHLHLSSDRTARSEEYLFVDFDDTDAFCRFCKLKPL